MRKQFENVDCKYGAPMGRPEVHKDFSGKSRCFKVNLYGGGCYDDGGAYWGGPSNLYCATNGEGFRMFTRQPNRKLAQTIFQERVISLGYKISWIN